MRWGAPPQHRRFPPFQNHAPFSNFYPRNPSTHRNSVFFRHPAWIHYPNQRWNQPTHRSYEKPSLDPFFNSPDHPPGFDKPIYLKGFKQKPFNIAGSESGRVYHDKRKAEEDEVIRKEVEGCRVWCKGDFDSVKKKLGKTILITNISSKVTKDEVLKACLVFGKVEGVNLYRSSMCADVIFSCVRFENPQQAEKALARLRGTRRFSRSWRVNWAKEEFRPNSANRSCSSVNGERNRDKGDSGKKIFGVKNDEVSNLLNRGWLLVMERQRSIKDVHKLLDDDGLKVLNLIRWGIYGVICICKDDNQMTLWQERKDRLKKWCIKVEKVEYGGQSLQRYCWLECKGIPGDAWSLGTMENIAQTWGKLLALDRETDMLYRMDVAKIFIETREFDSIDMKTSMSFNNEEFPIKVSEIIREDHVDFLRSQESCLGKEFSLPNSLDDGKSQNTVVLEEDDMDKDLGGAINMIHSDEANTISEKVVSTDTMGMNTTPVKPLEEDKSTSDEMEGEDDQASKEMDKGVGTVVLETQFHLGEAPVRTPIYNEKKGGQTLDIEQGPKENVKKSGPKNCSCCKAFRRSNGDSLGGLSPSNPIANSVPNKGETTSNAPTQRSKRIAKKVFTPTRRGIRDILGGRIEKNRKVKKKGKNTKNKGKDKVVASESSFSETPLSDLQARVERGVEICEELGLKLSKNSARKLEFSEFIAVKGPSINNKSPRKEQVKKSSNNKAKEAQQQTTK